MCRPFASISSGGSFDDGGLGMGKGGVINPSPAVSASAPVVQQAAPTVTAPVIATPVAPSATQDTAGNAITSPVAETAAEVAKRDARRRGRASTILTGGLGDANFGASVTPTALNATFLG